MEAMAMTTYALSEPATIFVADRSGDATAEVVGHGTLEECVDTIANFSADRRRFVVIQLDDIDLKYGPREVQELLGFLREETPGLSNTKIAEVNRSDL
jgi:hypothetical protein